MKKKKRIKIRQGPNIIENPSLDYKYIWNPWIIHCCWVFTGYVMFSCGNFEIFTGYVMLSCGDLEIFHAYEYSQVKWKSHVEILKYSLLMNIHRLCDVLIWRPWNIPCSWAFKGFVMFSCGDLEIFHALGHSQVMWCSHVETLKNSLLLGIHRLCDVLMWRP